MALTSVVYTSRATEHVTSHALDLLLLDARANNAAVGVTGVLLYDGEHFFQYFEGEREAVEDVYARIRRSRLHTHLVELEHQTIEQRRFHTWFMGFRSVPESVLQRLSHERWHRERSWVEDHSAASPGIRQLLAFIQPACA